VWQQILHADPSAIPLTQSFDGKVMAQGVERGAATSSLRLHPQPLGYTFERAPEYDTIQSVALFCDKEVR
jgi:hypothetical protein